MKRRWRNAWVGGLIGGATAVGVGLYLGAAVSFVHVGWVVLSAAVAAFLGARIGGNGGGSGEPITEAALVPLEEHVIERIMARDFQGALETSEKILGAIRQAAAPNSADHVYALLRVASFRDIAGKSGASKLREEAWRGLKTLPADQAPTLALALSDLAQQVRTSGRLEDTRELWERVLEVWAKATLAPPFELRLCHQQLAGLFGELEVHDRSVFHWRETVSLARQLPEAPFLEIDEGNLAWALARAGQHDEAEAMARLRVQALEPHREGLSQALEALAGMLELRGAWAEAEPLRRRALERFEADHGPFHASVSRAAADLARTLRAQNRSDEAEQALVRAVDIAERNANKYTEPYFKLLLAERLCALGEVVQLRSSEEAQSLLARAEKIREEVPRR